MTKVLPCKSCANDDETQIRFNVYVDQGLQWNVGSFCHCLVCGSMFRAKSTDFADLCEAWNSRPVAALVTAKPEPCAWRIPVKRDGKSYHEYTEVEAFNPDYGFYSAVGRAEALFDDQTVNALLRRLEELEGADKAAWNNWEAVEPVQNFLIEHDLLQTPFEGGGKSAGDNIVHSLRALLGTQIIQQLQDAVAPAVDKPIG